MRQTSLTCVYELAKKDKRIVFVGSDLGAGVLDEFKSEMPERFFMEGVSEQHVIGMAAGLAQEGYIVYINTIATFLTRRCYEQIVLELGLHNLPVRLLGSGGGLVYAPLGPTHLAIDDISIMRTIPNMTVVAPADSVEMKAVMMSTSGVKGPMYIRFAKGYDQIVTEKLSRFQLGRVRRVAGSSSHVIITTGITLQLAVDAKRLLKKRGIDPTILHIPTIKPLDKRPVIKSITSARHVVIIEEHLKTGGLQSAILEACVDRGITALPEIHHIALPDEFPRGYGSQKELMQKYGIHTEAIVQCLVK